MGQIITKLTTPLQQYNVSDFLVGRKKRKRSIDFNVLADEEANANTQAAKKKKLLTTTQYIYQALFKEQKNSDIAVMALGKVWNLHKVYLCQSPYFYSMFNGSWKEACQAFVHIKILDDRIALDALDAVFGSLYSDEIEIEPKAVISVLATATLFHLDGIIDKCAEVMIESINPDTAVHYYEAACQYGCLNVKKATFKWLETNLLCIYTKYQKMLRHISIELMTDLISSPDLYVMQTEFSLYTLLRTWIFLRLHPDYDPENPVLVNSQPATVTNSINRQTSQRKETFDKDASNERGSLVSTGIDGTTANLLTTPPTPVDAMQAYFVNRDSRRSFLATPEGRQFLPSFRALRTQYLTNHHMDLKIVLCDNIIPLEWLDAHVLTHWHSILKVDHSPEEGPQNLDEETFFKNCMRCGRILLEPGYQKWRWTGFNFGLDLILIADSRVLSIRRHHRNEHERLLSLQTRRQFMIRTSITSINAQRQPTFTQTSDITSLSIEKNEEVTLMLMDTKLVHPLLVSVSLLVVSPTNQKFKYNTPSSRFEDSTNKEPISEIGATCDRSTTPAQSLIQPTTEHDSNYSDDAVCLVPPSPPTVSSGSDSALASSSSLNCVPSPAILTASHRLITSPPGVSVSSGVGSGSASSLDLL